MTLSKRDGKQIPEMTAALVRRTFPKGNKYMTLRDELGELYTDDEFADLFSWKGEIAQAPGLLAMVCVMQYMEGLSDEQSAEAVRARIDWKYALGLELDDSGFDASVLSTFRRRLVTGGAEARIFEKLLQVCRDKELLKKRGRQRTDSTHVLGAVRDLNRLELVGETLRHALEVLAVAVPEWVRSQIPPDWYERYGQRMEQSRLPAGKAGREELGLTIGADGYALLSALYADESLAILHDHPAVQTVRLVWLQQYYRENDHIQWRQPADLPPAAKLINTPYDVEVRYSQKRQTHWKGYKAHMTESSDDDTPHLLVNVESTLATVPDCAVVPTVHTALAKKDLLPAEHLIDAGYMDAENVVTSRQTHQVTMVGPMLSDSSWQARQQAGFDISCFVVDWEAQKVICPTGQTSRVWSPTVDPSGDQTIHIRFAHSDCRACPCRSQCTYSASGPRGLRLRPQLEHELLQQMRQEQQTPAFKERYRNRAGIEGTLSEGVRAHDLRRSRYIGLAKTHLQHLLIATAINLTRLAHWFTAMHQNVPVSARRASTRTSRLAALAPS